MRTYYLGVGLKFLDGEKDGKFTFAILAGIFISRHTNLLIIG
jgi:hypothetical protein